MANYINIQQTEYNDLQTNLAVLHEDIIANEAEIRELVKELIEIEGGFYISMISEKISLLMSEMEVAVMEQLKSTFEDTEKAIEDFAGAVIEIDVVDM